MKNSIITKVCFRCNTEQPITEYYKHKKMADGHLNKCKTCTKSDSKINEDEKRKDPAFVEKEKTRAREKYHRLGYKDKHKPTPEQKKKAIEKSRKKYPEKYKAKNASQRIPKKHKSNHNHHWSYNEEHWKDVIEVTPKLHALIHRLMDYDQESKMYRNSVTGELLDTKEKHKSFMSVSKFFNINEFQ